MISSAAWSDFSYKNSLNVYISMYPFYFKFKNTLMVFYRFRGYFCYATEVLRVHKRMKQN